jgi:hypothetical protein
MTVMTTPQIRIVPFHEALRPSLFEFAKLIHPAENNLRQRLEWFIFGNPYLENKNIVPGLFAVTPDNQIIGQFLMAPFEYSSGQERSVGYFGYDFFVKEEYRAQGVGAFLFVQGVRTFKPFLGVGVTQPVEKIAAAANIKSQGSLKKFLWMSNPFMVGLRVINQRLFKSKAKDPDCVFAPSVDIDGHIFDRCTTIPEWWNDSTGTGESLDPTRSRKFIEWRFLKSPRAYHLYFGEGSYFAVRKAVYQGLRLLLIVDCRHAGKTSGHPEIILRAVKALARQAKLDGVVMAATCPQTEEILEQEGFFTAGHPSPVLVNLPASVSPETPISLSMADADLDFSFGEAA